MSTHLPHPVGGRTSRRSLSTYPPRMPARLSALLSVLLGCAAGCNSPALRPLQRTYKVVDPTIDVQGPLGRELGVGTEYGVVFLGRSAQSGEVDVTAWYGDGPSIEAALVEALGGGLYLASTEIRVPSVVLDFGKLEPGAEVLIRGRRGADVWTCEGKVRAHPDVDGLLLSAGEGFVDSDDQIGAGVYLRGPKGQEDEGLRLVGLLSGALEIDDGGARKRYLTAVGAQDLWRLTAWHRDLSHKRRWVYREDIL
jgi:hypothetical protein